MKPSRANVLTAAGLVGLLAAVTLTAPRWSRLLMRSLPGSGGGGGGAAARDRGRAGRGGAGARSSARST